MGGVGYDPPMPEAVHSRYLGRQEACGAVLVGEAGGGGGLGIGLSTGHWGH